MDDRRARPRKGIEFFFNKYIGGYPYMCRAVDISASGIQAVVIHEPSTALDAFPIELRVPGDSHIFWVWGRKVRSRGRRQSIEFTNLTAEESQRLARALE